MKALKLVILTLILLNLTAASAKYIGFSVSGLLSILSLLLLAVYYFFIHKGRVNLWLILVGLSYFLISSFSYIGETDFFIEELIKYTIVILGGYEIIKRTSSHELLWFYLIGASTVILHALFFQADNARYSGFYLNPNEAGFICISGFALCYGISKKSLRIVGQILFTLAGLLTFSRTFIVIWTLIILISLRIDVKNIRILIIGLVAILMLFVIGNSLNIKNKRFEQLKHLADNENVTTQELNEHSRTETWAEFYEVLMEKPVFGNGYGTFQGILNYNRIGFSYGVHNTYLLILGEAGIFAFMVFIGYFFYLFYNSLKLFVSHPNLFLQFIGLAFWCLASHNFFNFYYVLFSTMWIQGQIILHKKEIAEKKLIYDRL